VTGVCGVAVQFHSIYHDFSGEFIVNNKYLFCFTNWFAWKKAAMTSFRQIIMFSIHSEKQHFHGIPNYACKMLRLNFSVGKSQQVRGGRLAEAH